MELEGLKRCLSWLEENNIVIGDLVTDRHAQAKKFMKTERPDIEHWFDCWHVAKGVYKKLEAAGRKKGSEAVGDWARSISNHLYWFASSSEGNGELVQQKWLSILIIKSHMEMEKVVKGRLLLTDVKKLSPAEQTSGLEAFHKVVCHFAPKLVHFFHAQMEARLFLAALHFNENSDREQRLTKDGRLQYDVSYPKGRDHDGISKEIKKPMTYGQYFHLLLSQGFFFSKNL
ncbi:hypothetical protein FSP39_021291 [Pinctada imbricata]|uniref:Uncharacterized protein n=1 Tax=Pinctada imbricata TaxID=66713 RepID=A0AA88Y6C0_PINIB|nr:hypothetical protein FSP39_021291 [Pinctada imbricata]